jgi:hypothetical protein
MAPDTAPVTAARRRLEQLANTGQALEAEGLPFPTRQIQDAVNDALAEHDLDQANTVLKRGEALIARVGQDWTWVRELLRRADELRAIAGTLGVDLQHLDSRVGNPRVRLSSEPLSSGSMEKAAASASLALAVLNDAVPKFCLQEAQTLGKSIRKARDRGEDVRECARSFSRLLQSIQDQNLPSAAQRLVETRKMVARIPRAPALPALSPREEEEILLEARNLARRLQRIKGKARDASSAARLMAQVRQALSEDRRYGTPEEEIEELWLVVDRLAKERKHAADIGAASPDAPVIEAADVEAPSVPRLPENEEAADEVTDDPDELRPLRRSLLVPYLPPESLEPPDPVSSENEPGGPARLRTRPRPRP